uniref:hypothetical protein n=1 Tax=Crossiella equi TaxID=130796 RepID=UPI001B7FFEF8
MDTRSAGEECREVLVRASGCKIWAATPRWWVLCGTSCLLSAAVTKRDRGGRWDGRRAVRGL